jgi:hypothetical protein
MPTPDRDEQVNRLLDSLGDREPTYEEVAQFIALSGPDVDVVVACIEAEIAKEQRAAAELDVSVPGPASDQANDTLPRAG